MNHAPITSARRGASPRKLGWLSLAVLTLCALIAAACGSDDDDSAATTAAPTTAAPATTAAPTTAAPQLADVCPADLRILTDWFPEPEHAYLYQMIGTDGVIDAENGTYTGPIGDGSVTMQIQAGGPYINFNGETAQFYSDQNLFMAYVSTSAAIETYVNTPVVHVFTNFEVGPQILMWDPDVYDFDSFEDIGQSDATVLYFGGASYMDYLIAEGVIQEDQVDGTYDGSPGRFITEGDLVQQGFATNEPWRYENEIEGWMKPVEFLLIHDTGHEIYQSALSVRPEAVTEDADCLEQLVPMMQQALVDYMNAPEPINVRLDQIVKELDSFWTSSEASHAAGTRAMRDFGLVTDGDNGYVGDFDEARIADLIDILIPVFEGRGVEGFEGGNPDITAAELYTNEFLDTSISLGY